MDFAVIYNHQSLITIKHRKLTLASVPTTRSLSSIILSLMLSLYRFSIALCAVRFSPRPPLGTGDCLLRRLIGTFSVSTTCTGMLVVVKIALDGVAVETALGTDT